MMIVSACSPKPPEGPVVPGTSVSLPAAWPIAMLVEVAFPLSGSASATAPAGWAGGVARVSGDGFSTDMTATCHILGIAGRVLRYGPSGSSVFMFSARLAICVTHPCRWGNRQAIVKLPVERVEADQL